MSLCICDTRSTNHQRKIDGGFNFLKVSCVKALMRMKRHATNWECLKITYTVFYNSNENAWKTLHQEDIMKTNKDMKRDVWHH